MFDEMFSKTTKNFAAKRNLFVASIFMDEEHHTSIGDARSESDAELVYISSSRDRDDEVTLYPMTFFGNHWLPAEVKEELPAHINDEKHLREVIDFISKSI